MHLAIVKSVRKAAAKAGEYLDEEDRRLLAQAGILAGGVLGTAMTFGLAVRLFFLAMG